MKERIRLAGARLLRGGQFEDIQSVDRPTVRARHRAELVLRFRQRDEEARLALANALHQELQGHRGLAGSGLTLNEVETVGGKPAAEHLVEARNAGADFRFVGSVFHSQSTVLLSNDCTNA